MKKNSKDEVLPIENDVSRIKMGYEEALKEIKVSAADKKNVLLDSISNVIKGELKEKAPLFKYYFKTQEEYSRNIEEQKQIEVFNELFSRVDDLAEFKEKLQIMLTEDQYGLMLFNKYKRISESTPFVEEGIKILSYTLEKLVNDDFKNKFSQHNYFLEIIDKLSIQALILLIDHKNWPEQIQLNSSGRYVLGQAIVEDWYVHYAMEYNTKSGRQLDVMLLELAVRELYSNGLFTIYQDGANHSVALTIQGASLLTYISEEDK